MHPVELGTLRITKAEPRLELNADNYAFYGGQCRADSSVMSIAMMLHKRADSTIKARKVLNGVKASASSSSNEPEWKVLSRGVVPGPISLLDAIGLVSKSKQFKLRFGSNAKSATIQRILGAKANGAWPSTWEAFKAALASQSSHGVIGIIEKLAAHWHL